MLPRVEIKCQGVYWHHISNYDLLLSMWCHGVQPNKCRPWTDRKSEVMKQKWRPLLSTSKSSCFYKENIVNWKSNSSYSRKFVWAEYLPETSYIWHETFVRDTDCFAISAWPRSRCVKENFRWLMVIALDITNSWIVGMSDVVELNHSTLRIERCRLERYPEFLIL